MVPEGLGGGLRCKRWKEVVYGEVWWGSKAWCSKRVFLHRCRSPQCHHSRGELGKMNQRSLVPLCHREGPSPRLAPTPSTRFSSTGDVPGSPSRRWPRGQAPHAPAAGSGGLNKPHVARRAWPSPQTHRMVISKIWLSLLCSSVAWNTDTEDASVRPEPGTTAGKTPRWPFPGTRARGGWPGKI